MLFHDHREYCKNQCDSNNKTTMSSYSVKSIVFYREPLNNFMKFYYNCSSSFRDKNHRCLQHKISQDFKIFRYSELSYFVNILLDLEHSGIYLEIKTRYNNKLQNVS